LGFRELAADFPEKLIIIWSTTQHLKMTGLLTRHSRLFFVPCERIWEKVASVKMTIDSYKDNPAKITKMFDLQLSVLDFVVNNLCLLHILEADQSLMVC
jgi:hypothetical protein